MRGPTDTPRSMDPHEKLKLRTAAYRVRNLDLPPGIAELIARELMVWEEFGYRLGTSSLVRQVVDEIMKWPTPLTERERRMSGAVGYE